MMREAQERPLIVRCINRMTFEVDRKTLDAKHVSQYDAYCFSDPDPAVDYISEAEWHLRWLEQSAPTKRRMNDVGTVENL